MGGINLPLLKIITMYQEFFPFVEADKFEEVPEGLSPDLSEVMNSGIVPATAKEAPHNELEVEDIGFRCGDTFDALELRKAIGSEPRVTAEVSE